MTTTTTRYAAPRLKGGQYIVRIGYSISGSGTRVRKDHYLGDNEQIANARAISIQQDWDRITAEAARQLDPVPPIWPEKARPAVPASPTVKVINPTLGEMTSLFVQAKRSEVGLAGIKASTFNEIVTGLENAVGLRGGRTPIDISLKLSQVNRGVLQTFVEFWFKAAVGKQISNRTARNYITRFKEALNWAADEEQFSFVLPRGTQKAFKVKLKVRTKRKDAYDQTSIAALKAVLKNAPDRVRLYVLLSLNCGSYQKDISDLLVGDLVVEGDDAYLVRGRSKTEHQNSFETRHWLFPEVAALLAKCRASENEHDRLLLNARGLPLVREEVDGTRTSAIDAAYARVRDAAKVDLPFKQGRKIAWNWMRGHGGLDLAKQFAGQALVGIAQNYENENYWDGLTKGLKEFHKQLTTDAIL